MITYHLQRRFDNQYQPVSIGSNQDQEVAQRFLVVSALTDIAMMAKIVTTHKLLAFDLSAVVFDWSVEVAVGDVLAVVEVLCSVVDHVVDSGYGSDHLKLLVLVDFEFVHCDVVRLFEMELQESDVKLVSPFDGLIDTLF